MNKIKGLFHLFLLVCCMFNVCAFAQTQNIAKAQQLVDTYLQSHQKGEHISAVALSIKQPNVATTQSVYAGTTAYEGQQQLTGEHLFNVGSITKSFIAAILLQLESKQYFSLDDHVDKYFPEYSNWNKVTIRQLLNMTSGIPDYVNDFRFVLKFFSDPYQEYQPADLLAFSYQKSLLFEPGQQWNYSNANYILLGMLVEKLTGHSLTEEINTRIIFPLQLNHTVYIAHMPDSNTKPYLVRGYIYLKNLGGVIPRGTDVTDYTSSVAGAAGAIYSNTEDLVTWASALFTPGKLLTADEIKKLSTKVSIITGQPIEDVSADEPIGFGLGIIQLYMADIEGPVYSYGGMGLGGRALYFYTPARDVVIAATINSSVDREDDHIRDLVGDAYNLTTAKALHSRPQLIDFDQPIKMRS